MEEKDMSNWYLQSGKESDVVISSRVRLARNIKEFIFNNYFQVLSTQFYLP